MQAESILGSSGLVAFAYTSQPEQARAFYEGVLGLRFVEFEAPFALVFDLNGIMLRIGIHDGHQPSPSTVLGWQVDDIASTVDRLTAAGVQFTRYAGLNDKDPRGIWTSPTGAQIAWFHDPDKNVLSLTQF